MEIVNIYALLFVLTNDTFILFYIRASLNKVKLIFKKKKQSKYSDAHISTYINNNLHMLTSITDTASAKTHLQFKSVFCLHLLSSSWV